MPPHGPVHRDELRRRGGRDQEDHRERRLLLGGADAATSTTPSRTIPAAIDALFKKRAIERIEEWLALADERLAGKNTDVYICPGNDDWWEIDDMIAQLQVAHALRRHDRASSRTTPWSRRPAPIPPPGTPPARVRRTSSPSTSTGSAAGSATSPKDFENVIFNFHVPPVRLFARPLSQARRQHAHGRRGEDPRRQRRGEAGDREVPAARSACTGTSTSRAAPRRRAARS